MVILDRKILCVTSASAYSATYSYSSTLPPYSYSNCAPRSDSPCAHAYLPYNPTPYTPTPTPTAASATVESVAIAIATATAAQATTATV